MSRLARGECENCADARSRHPGLRRDDDKKGASGFVGAAVLVPRFEQFLLDPIVDTADAHADAPVVERTLPHAASTSVSASAASPEMGGGPVRPSGNAAYCFSKAAWISSSTSSLTTGMP